MRKQFRLTKDTLACMCAAAGMQPEIRRRYKQFDVFIADGFTANPGVAFRRFGIEPDAYPYGAFVTMWAVAKGEDHIEIASILTEDAFKGHGAEAKATRLKAAIYKASEFIARREKVSKSGAILNA